MYARLDELDASIAEVTAAISGDPDDLRKAKELRASVLPMPQVEELFHGWIDSEGLSPEATAMLTEQNVRPPSRVRPSEEARKAYRELVRKAHPDLAQEDAERERREAFLIRVNRAYAEGDTEALAGTARRVDQRARGGGTGSRAAAERAALRPAGVAGGAQGSAGGDGPARWSRARSARC